MLPCESPGTFTSEVTVRGIFATILIILVTFETVGLEGTSANLPELEETVLVSSYPEENVEPH